jgi:hypothetical protein
MFNNIPTHTITICVFHTDMALRTHSSKYLTDEMCIKLSYVCFLQNLGQDLNFWCTSVPKAIFQKQLYIIFGNCVFYNENQLSLKSKINSNYQVVSLFWCGFRRSRQSQTENQSGPNVIKHFLSVN